MALVNYSDSESDGESASAPPATKRLQVSLPSLKPEAGQQNNDADTDGPPAKRARTGGFNALLPPPKKAPVLMKKGVNLKTSSEAAFSRNPLPLSQQADEHSYTAPDLSGKKDSPPPEPEFVGKATTFLPLSVSSKKKRKPLPKIRAGALEKDVTNGTTDVALSNHVAKEAEPAKPKPKKLFFSVTQEEEKEEEDVPAGPTTGNYEFITIDQNQTSQEETIQPTYQQATATSDPNSLEAVAADMNLTQAQRRQLFGRNGKDAKVTHFDMDAQYAENERARQAGEVVEHRAVKAVAPGKHSLQQLVNNSQSQQEALKDKWADGKRARGEGGSKYGWST